MIKFLFAIQRHLRLAFPLMLAAVAGVAFLSLTVSGADGLTGTADPSRSAAQASPSAGGESLTLIGTGLHAGGGLALFDGNRAEFKTTVHLGEKIAGCTVAAILFDRVRLQSADGEFEVPVSGQWRHDGAGVWRVVDGPAPVRPIEPAPETPSSAVAVGNRLPPASANAPLPSGPAPSDKELLKLDKKLIEAIKKDKSMEKVFSGDGVKLVKREMKEMRRAK